MKQKKFEIFFFLVGLGIFSYLVYKFGVGQIIQNIYKAGWSLLAAICVWFFIYLLNTISWKLALGKNGKSLSFPYLFLITVSGFVINYITPFLAIGGEPYKIKKLAQTIGARQSLSAVVLYRMMHLLGHMLLLLTGIVLALAFIPLSTYIAGILLFAAVLISIIIVLTLIGHRGGIFKRLQRFVDTFPVFGTLSNWLHGHEEQLVEMDYILTLTFQTQRNQFYLALFAEYLSRALMGFEVYLIVNGVGMHISLVSALFVYIVYSIAINVLFFVPFNLGAREGGIYMGLETLALPPLFAVYFGIVMRVREFFWILLGLLFILLTHEKKDPSHAIT
ncbi:MAG: lysylphosphatidylglycerol synthase transmembrane domain-containing protein [Bacteroidota bacterium]